MSQRLAVLDASTLTFCSPVWVGAERRVRGWAERFGLVGSVDEGERLARMGQGRMAGFVAPLAAPGELDLLAQWGALIALVDDGFDRADAPPEPAEVRRVLDALTAVLLGHSAAQDSTMPAVRAMADLWLRTVVGTSPRWCEQFAAHYRDFAEATCHEAEVRESGRPMALDEYLQMRRHTITVLPMLDLVERSYPLEPSLDPLRDAAADIVGWSNDLASASRERAEGTDAINLVTVLADEGSGDLAEAAATARAMISTRMNEFDDAARQVVADAGPGRMRLVDQVAVIRTFLDGALAWQAETGRNRPVETDGQDGPPSVDRPAPGIPEEGHGGGYHDSLERLTRRLSLAVAPTGAIADWCGSRVLESALLLALLRKTATHERHQRRLVAFLESRRAAADRIDALLIDASLNPDAMASTAGPIGEAMSADLNRGTGGRGQFKAVMLQAVLHLLCCAPLHERQLPPAIDPGGITTFTDVNVLATRVIYAHATGWVHTVSETERERLVALLGAGGNRMLWEASATTDLLGLHALRLFRPGAPLLADGLLRMTLAQNPDGGMPFLDSQDGWLAAVAGLAFLDEPGLRPLTGRMAGFVAAWQAPDGGWPFASGMVQTDLDTATRAMEFLHAADPARYRGHLERGARYLADMAHPSGGFPTWVRTDAPDLDMTAGAILALAPAGPRYAHLLEPAARFVLDAQRPDGTFERSWTISESSGILRALDALRALPTVAAPLAERIAEASARATAYLAATQNLDGGWGQDAEAESDVLSTAQALPVLVRDGQDHAARRAVAYLLSRQESDGSFSSIPDQVGPRPLPFDYPILASIHALTALHSAEHIWIEPAAPPRPAVWAPGSRISTTTRWRALAARMRGQVLEPHDAAYEGGRILVNQRYDAVRPQAIAYPVDAQDVAACVDFARENSVPLAIRSGGHSYAGYSTGPGLVVHLRGMNSIALGEGRVRMGAGTMGMAAHGALGAVGAGLPLGRCPSIGVAGATLGGGLSAFTRAWGLAVDHLRGVQIVTADGQVREVGEHSEGADRELFWAMLGGGGGNFGIVTALDFSTVDIRGLTFAGMAVRWPLRDLAALISGWSAWNADPRTPRELRTAIELLSDGGKPCEVAVTGTFIGSPADLDPHLDRLAAVVGRPESHRLSYPCSYVQAAAEPERWGAGTFGPRVAFAAKSQIVRSPLSSAAAAAMAEAVERVHAIGGVTGASGLLIDSLGGAVADTDATATAFPHRNAVGVVQYHSYWHQATPEAEIRERIEWLREIHAEMHPHLGTGGYVNGMDPELADWETAYHAENYPRLQQVKAAVDPEQFFTFPQAITPAARPTDPDSGGVRVPAPRRGSVAGAPSGADLERLARQLHGRLLRPGEHEFETARLVHNQRYDTVVPTAIARIADEHDAATCLAFAAEADIPIAIRSGGHSYAGYCTTRGLVIDVASLDSVSIGSVGANRVRIGAGVSSMAAGRALADRGLAIAAGRWGSVSVSGLTLGGGKSAFTRAWGLSCDRMTGATIVTPDGRTRHVTDSPEDQDADLYWALRGGGGGNFGVVTALDFTPVDITGQSFAHFQIQWPHQEMMRALQGWQHWISDPRTPREISCDVRLMLDGTGPARPIVHGAWIGGPAELRRTIETLIAAVGRPPERMDVTPCSYVQAAMVAEHPLHDSGTPAGSAWPTPTYRTEPGSGPDGRLAWAGKSHIVRQPMTEAATATLITGIDQLHRLGATGGFYLDSLGGAVADLAPDATAYPHRDALAVLQYITTWPRTCPPWHAAARRESMRATHAAMQAHLGAGAYVNDTDPELLGWERSYYGENYPRLQRIKTVYDPLQILDFAQGVKPA